VTYVKKKQSIENTERRERVQLVAQLMQYYLTIDPNRADEWRYKKFDSLYDMPLDALRCLAMFYKNP